MQYDSNTFQITVYTLSPADRGCAQLTSPFETTIALPATDLSAGSYTVIANGVSAVFTLPVENTTPNSNPTVASTSISTATPANASCTDSSKFVADVTIPDNTVVASNTPFTKTWRLKNTGSCTWDSSYLVYYISGTTMSQQPGYWIVNRDKRSLPGESVDIVSHDFQLRTQLPILLGIEEENGPLMPIQGGANGNSFYSDQGR
jgi:hypothetical protein